MNIKYYKEINQNLFKGLLILLVIADHNDFLRTAIPNFFIGLSFHVIGFFFIYYLNAVYKNFTIESTLKKSLRLYKTYLIFLLLAALILKHEELINYTKFISELVHTVRTGNFVEIKNFSGVGMLWFIPSFVTFMLMSQLLIKMNSILIRLISFVGFFVILATNEIISVNINMNILALFPTIYIFFLCNIIYISITHLKISRNKLFLLIIIYIILKYLQIKYNLNQEIGTFSFASKDFFKNLISSFESITGVLLVIELSKGRYFTMIEYIGKNSLKFYIFHPFIGFIFFQIFQRFHYSGGNLLTDILIYIAIVITTAIFVEILNRIKKIETIFF